MKGKIIRVTATIDFLIPDYDSSPDETTKDWFEGKHSNFLTGYHAYRDGHRIGNSEKVLKVETIEDIGGK